MKNPSSIRLFRLGRIAVACGVSVFLMLPAQGADSAHVGAYDFAYASAGDAAARPIQVFDDGRSTFMQFRPGMPIPAIFSKKTGAPQLVVPVLEGPYVRVADVHGMLLLQVGRAQAQVVHSGGARPDAPMLSVNTPEGKQPFMPGTTYPQGSQLVASNAPVPMTADNAPAIIDDRLERNSYATPRKGDRVVWNEAEVRRDETQVWFKRGTATLTNEARRAIANAARAGSRSHYTVIGRDDDTYKEGLDKLRAQVLREAFVNAGASEDQITTRTGIAGKGRKDSWPSDVIVETRPEGESSRSSGVIANLQALVRDGVLRQDQAEAIAANRGVVMARTSVPAEPTIAKSQGPVAFTLAATDKTIQGAVRRWATASNYQLVWDAPARLDAPIVGDATIAASSLEEALNRLLAGLASKGYALDATVYKNKVIRLSAGAPAATAAGSGAPAVQPAAPAPIHLAPAPDPRVPEKQAPRSVAEPPQWLMRQGDGTVQRLFARWGQQARRNVVWAAHDQVAITGDAVVNAADIKAATEQVIASAAAAGYRLRLAERDDRTLIVSNY